MSDRIRKAERANFVAELSLGIAVPLFLLGIVASVIIEGGVKTGPLYYVAMGIGILGAVICLGGLAVSGWSADKNPPSMGDFMYGSRD